MAENLLSLSPEVMNQLYMADFYTEFWKLAGEADLMTSFATDEKNIAQHVLQDTRSELNPIRRQYLAMTLMLFNEMTEAQRLIDKRLLPPQLVQDKYPR